MSATQFDVLFDPAGVDRRETWSPGFAVPCFLVLFVAVPWLGPGAIWLSVIGGGGWLVMWLWFPVKFWLLGAAPLIEASRTDLRVTASGRTRVEPLHHFESAVLDIGERTLLTKGNTFAFVRFTRKPEHDPRFERYWSIDLPLRGRGRRAVVTGLARALAERGVPTRVTGVHPAEDHPAA